MNGTENVATGGWLIQNTTQATQVFRALVPYVLRNVRPDMESYFSCNICSSPFRSTQEQLHFLYWFPSFCNSSFISWSSNFWMSTRCFIRNFPFKWKTGISYLYLSYHAEFSGRVISTSCNINCDRKVMLVPIGHWKTIPACLLIGIFFTNTRLLGAFWFILPCCRQLPILWIQNVCSHNPWLHVHKELSP